MVINFNDKIRNNVFKNSNLFDTFTYIDSLTDEQIDFVYKLIVSDFYKTLLYQKIFLNYNFDMTVFNRDINQIVDRCIEDDEFFIKILRGANSFNKLDFITKTIIFDEIDNLGYDQIIEYTNPLHILDKLTYQIIDDLDCYNFYYKDFVSSVGYEDLYFFDDYISNRILNLKKNDINKYKKYILVFIRDYYKWFSFKKEVLYDKKLSNNDINYLNEIKNQSLDYLFDKIENDEKFLNCIIHNYFLYSSKKEGIKKEVESYFNSVDDIEIQKKIGKKNDSTN